MEHSARGGGMASQKSHGRAVKGGSRVVLASVLLALTVLAGLARVIDGSRDAPSGATAAVASMSSGSMSSGSESSGSESSAPESSGSETAEQEAAGPGTPPEGAVAAGTTGPTGSGQQPRAATRSVVRAGPDVRDLTVVAPTGDDAALRVRFRTEPGARYGLVVAHRPERDGGTVPADGQAEAVVWLPDGRYRLTLRVSAGDTLTTTTAAVHVDVGAPTLEIVRSSPPTSGRVVWAVRTSAGASGVLTVPDDGSVAFRADDEGRAVVALELSDGRHRAGSVTVTDQLGREARGETKAFRLDTTPPALEVEPDLTAAAAGLLRISLAAEPGAEVNLRARAVGDGEVRLAGTLTADAQPTVWEREIAGGSYDLEVVATDPMGNESRRILRVGVGDPLTAGEVLGILLLLLAVAGLPVAFVVRNRRRLLERFGFAGAGGRRPADGADGVRRRNDHLRRVAAYEGAEAAWAARRTELVELDRIAREEIGREPGPRAVAEARLRRGERVFATAPAVLVEESERQGAVRRRDRGAGRAVITDRRVIFLGDRGREWLHTELITLTWHPDGTVLLPVTGRAEISGLRFVSQAERARLCLRLAVADVRGGRDRVAGEAADDLAEHEARRPVPPAARPAVADGATAGAGWGSGASSDPSQHVTEEVPVPADDAGAAADVRAWARSGDRR